MSSKQVRVKFSKEYELKQLIFDAVSKTLENVNLTYQVKEERPIFKSTTRSNGSRY